MMLDGVNVYLIGMMGVGKTTVGQELAKLLQYQFIDTDQVIETVTKEPIAQTFKVAGEETFRKIETQVLSEVCAFTYLVVATGGGIVLSPKNWSYLHHGLVVWLDGSVELLLSRLVDDRSRPLLLDSDPRTKLECLLRDRQAFYNQADLRITVSAMDSPMEIANRIILAIPSVLKYKG